MPGPGAKRVGSLTVVMYHYVRQLERSRYPRIKGLDTAEFIGQVSYMEKFYTFVTIADCIAALDAGAVDELPPNAALLTFDDGYIDHYLTVFPHLEGKKIQGAFFPPAAPVLEHKVLDVNKIHFILAGADNENQVLEDVYRLLDEFRGQHDLMPNSYYFEKLTREKGRYDRKEVVFIKRLLQRELSETLRGQMVHRLFDKYVSADEAGFARELYMDVEQLACMSRNGMHIGCHGHRHYWLDRLTAEQQAQEIDLSLEFLSALGIPDNNWTICYPYGAYDTGLLVLLRRRGCRLGFTTEVGIATLSPEHALTLSRLNTNDLPKSAGAPAGEWTSRVCPG